MAGIGDLADGILGGFERMRERAGELFEPTVRLGVTGLAGAGKTVFITALVASLLERQRMRLLKAEAEGRIVAARLTPQPDADVPRFAFETHRDALIGSPPAWPESTRSVSQLRIAILHRPGGLLGSLTGEMTLNVDIIDYPGEWLIDLPLIDQSYEEWSSRALATAESPARRAHAEHWHAALGAADPSGPHDESVAEALAGSYRDYLAACRRAGLSALAPGRFLMPGDYEGSPALSFAPLPKPQKAGRGTLYRQMRDRFEAYKRVIVKPFFRSHFARLDRQIVLIDALSALATGPRAVADLTATMAETLACFRHGQSSWLDRLVGGKRIDRILFAASKADHLHSAQHARLTALVERMLADAARQAAFGGARTKGMAIAAIRATTEQEISRNGEQVEIVRGRNAEGREIAIYPGELPEDAGALLAAARSAAPGEAPADWPDGAFADVDFAPPAWKGAAPPHIRLDAAVEYVLGDRLE